MVPLPRHAKDGVALYRTDYPTVRGRGRDLVKSQVSYCMDRHR